MYDIKWIREHPQDFDRGLTRRGLEPLSGKLIKLAEERRALITRREQAQARRNAASKEIGQAKAKKDEATAQKLMAEVAKLKTSIPDMEAKEKEASAALEKELAQIPIRRSTRCRTARTSTAMSNTACGARSGITHSPPSSILN